MLKLNTMYRPLTARPFLTDHTYMEYRPCVSLRPYIACYWTQSQQIGRERVQKVLVIPDTCMDIIVRINHSRGEITGGICTMQDEPVLAAQEYTGEAKTSFAIRFYFWAAYPFLKLDFKDTKNQMLSLEALGKEWRELFHSFLYITDIRERIARTEYFLLKKLDGAEEATHLLNAVSQILLTSGRASAEDICSYSCICQRQMERLFLKQVGIPMKRLSSLVRYQNVWKDMVQSRQFDIQDAVYRYGYTDQAHLLKEFKRFHGISPKEAKLMAEANR